VKDKKLNFGEIASWNLISILLAIKETLATLNPTMTSQNPNNHEQTLKNSVKNR
jgi:hypothetical protein